jgi:dTDP-4-amino-4,6-dideoxygalactose transaminase
LEALKNIPLSDTKTQYHNLKNELDAAIAGVLERSWFILGQEVESFEQEFAAFLGSKYCVGVANGTDAISIALRACGVGPGDEVITAAHTAVFTVLAISQVGATPVFADIDSATGLLDPTQVEKYITPRTKVLLPVHLYGQAVDLNPFLQLARRYNLKVVEDSCQAHGALYKGQATGTFGVCGTFSFYPSKNLGAFGDGGAITTDDPELYQTIKMLRNGGQRDRYHHEVVGVNSRLDEMQAAILRVKLPHLTAWNTARRERAILYNKLLEDSGVELPVEREWAHHVYHLYVIRLQAQAERDALQAFLKENGVGTAIHYPIPAHLQKAYKFLNIAPGSLPQTEQTASRILSLPMYPELPFVDLERVATLVRTFKENNRITAG